MSDYVENDSLGSIAIIGMAGRFPGASDLDQFWRNLADGVESIRFFNRDELIQMGIDAHLLDNPKFVAADAILEGMDLFDAAFFDYSAREAEITDPQHRLFLESAWEALESAGYNSELYEGRTAVYAGANLSGYMIRNLYSNPGLVENVGTFKIMLANGQDFLATKVSYKMNLRGPSVNVNTLCSSSMVAVHYACQNLLNYGCDLAIAGGVNFQVSRNEAFFYQEGGIGSSDGHCRAFDSKANGTVSGSGLSIVVLKRLEDALADGDYIHAVIKGTGINNDGSSKNSYTAPNVDGQAECIAEAIAISGVDPETITYIDAHGTGTDLGDPIEIAALTKAFRSYTKKKQFCAIGSVKTNIGHLVNAGGAASLLKTVLAMKHRVIPPSLNFEAPNPKIDFANSPFYVNTRLSKWESMGAPLRAGVSSFGIGGTNTHVVLEEAPQMEESGVSARSWQLISFSAKTGTALKKMTGNLAAFIAQQPGLNLADIAFTLHVGRRNFNHRRVLVCRDPADLAEKLASLNPDYVFTHFQKPKDHPVVFIFPGEGEYGDMGRELYNTEVLFRDTVDDCLAILESVTNARTTNLRDLIFTNGTHQGETFRNAAGVCIHKALLFTVEYALAKLLMSWGIEPQYLAGEGTGEYVAACLGEVFTVGDALKIALASDELLIEVIAKIDLHNTRIQFVSGVSGAWITEVEATSREYWIRQRKTNQFVMGLQEVVKDSDQILIEIGPKGRLADEANRWKRQDAPMQIFHAMSGDNSGASGLETLLKCVGRFWLAGGRVDWNKFYAHEKRRRIPLPTYPFERQRYWIEPGKRFSGNGEPDVYISGPKDITKEIVGKGYNEATIKLTFNLMDATDLHDNEPAKKKLEEILELKERLEILAGELNDNYAKVEVSALGLGTADHSGKFDPRSHEKLKKRPRPELETPYIPPNTETERVIIEKWQEVLGFDKIGIRDDFFELGGHSLIAAAVATELSKRFDIQIPMRTLFETTTAAGIAELIETYKWALSGANEAASDEEVESGTI